MEGDARRAEHIIAIFPKAKKRVMSDVIACLILDAIGVSILVISLLVAIRRILKCEVKKQVTTSARIAIEIRNYGIPSDLINKAVEDLGDDAGEEVGEKNVLGLLTECIASAPGWLLLGMIGVILIFADNQIAYLVLRPAN
jgi:hypothetical protein